jgi:hypothetical protein
VTFTMHLTDGPRRWTTAILVAAALAGLVVLVASTRGRARLCLALAASMVVLAALSLAGLLIGYWHVDHDPSRRPRLLMPGAALTLGPLTWHMALAVALAAAGVAAAWHGPRSRS